MVRQIRRTTSEATETQISGQPAGLQIKNLQASSLAGPTDQQLLWFEAFSSSRVKTADCLIFFVMNPRYYYSHACMLGSRSGQAKGFCSYSLRRKGSVGTCLPYRHQSRISRHLDDCWPGEVKTEETISHCKTCKCLKSAVIDKINWFGRMNDLIHDLSRYWHKIGVITPGKSVKSLSAYAIKTKYSKVRMVRVSKPHDTGNQSQAAFGVRLVASGQTNRSKNRFCHSYECSNFANYWQKKAPQFIWKGRISQNDRI